MVQPDPAPYPLGAHRRGLDEHLGVEAAAWIAGQRAITLALTALIGWRQREIDRGTFLAMLSAAGGQADLALTRGWSWLADRDGEAA
jgi:hypothetical protein